MRRTALIAAGFLVLAALASWSGAASAREAGLISAGATAQTKPKLPALPATSRSGAASTSRSSATRRRSGTSTCSGRHAGFDVEIARWFSRFAFGMNRATFTCVTTPAREPALTSDRVDMVIATFTYSRSGHPDRLLPGVLQGDRPPARCECRAGQLRLPAGGEDDLDDHGSIYDRWVKNCFKDTKPASTDSFTNA